MSPATRLGLALFGLLAGCRSQGEVVPTPPSQPLPPPISARAADAGVSDAPSPGVAKTSDAAPAQAPRPDAGPAPDANPMVVTQSLMLSIGSGKTPLARFLDARAGVVFIDHSPDASGGASGVVAEKPSLKCGDALAQLAATVQKRMASANGVRAAYQEGRLRCRNQPGPPTCTFGRAMEGDPAVHLVFRVDAARGLLLRAVTLDDEAAVPEERVAAEHRAQAALIERLAASGCPGF